MNEDLEATLHTIAAALGPLHDDAFNPTRAIATHVVEVNEFTRPYLTANEHVTTHPGLRHPTGAGTLNTPKGDQDARKLYDQAVHTISTTYTALVPHTRPDGPADMPPPPAHLISMLATIRRALQQITLEAAVEHHAKPLRQLATNLNAWTETWTPEPDYPVCSNPQARWRCQGHPVIANGLCNSCYHHQRRQEAQAS